MIRVTEVKLGPCWLLRVPPVGRCASTGDPQAKRRKTIARRSRVIMSMPDWTLCMATLSRRKRKEYLIQYAGALATSSRCGRTKWRFYGESDGDPMDHP